MHKDIRQLTADDRDKPVVFVAVQRARTFGEQERISGVISVLVNKMVAIGATEELAGETLGLTPGREYRDIFLWQLVQQVSYIDHLLSKEWYLLETKPEHPFFVSDNPVVMENSNDLGPYGNIGLVVLGIQIYLPLSSMLMLAMYCPSIREKMARDKQSLQQILAKAPNLIPSHMRPRDMLEHVNRHTV